MIFLVNTHSILSFYSCIVLLTRLFRTCQTMCANHDYLIKPISLTTSHLSNAQCTHKDRQHKAWNFNIQYCSPFAQLKYKWVYVYIYFSFRSSMDIISGFISFFNESSLFCSSESRRRAPGSYPSKINQRQTVNSRAIQRWLYLPLMRSDLKCSNERENGVDWRRKVNADQNQR